MDAAVFERVEGMDLATADRVRVEAMLADLALLEGWVECRRTACVRRLSDLAGAHGDPVVEQSVAAASKQTRRSASRVVRRAKTLSAHPSFEDALGEGRVSSEHVDVMTRAADRLEPAGRDRLVREASRLVALAAASSPEEFEKSLSRETAGWDDGEERLRRRRRLTALKHWVDKATGMICLRGAYDPERGRTLVGRIDAMAKQLADGDLPEDCPTEPEARNDQIRALALLELTEPGEGGGTRSGRPETLLVVDVRTAESGVHAHSILDWGVDVDLPYSAIRRAVFASVVVPVVMRDGVVVEVIGDGPLDRGRSQRLPSRAQRRALRAMYLACAVPGCGVRFTHTRIHHVHWWEQGGATDLGNLLPLCSRHHHAVHDGGWQLHLDPTTRWLTVSLPDGTVMSTGPPHAGKT